MGGLPSPGLVVLDSSYRGLALAGGGKTHICEDRESQKETQPSCLAAYRRLFRDATSHTLKLALSGEGRRGQGERRALGSDLPLRQDALSLTRHQGLF